MKQLTPEKKEALDNKMTNFRSCCRFLGITDRMLYEDLLADTGVQDKYNFRTFQTSLGGQATCLARQNKEVFAEIKKLHAKMITEIKKQLNEIGG